MGISHAQTRLDRLLTNLKTAVDYRCEDGKNVKELRGDIGAGR
jgi:hypothetical protein